MPYLDYIESHPLFEKYQNNNRYDAKNKWRYEPFYVLGKKVEQRVKQFLLYEREKYIDTFKDRYSKELADYIPFNEVGAVNKHQKWHLRSMVEDLLGEDHWPYKSNENKVAADFWNAALYYIEDVDKEDKDLPAFSSMRVLNVIAKLCRYVDFDDFIRQCFSKDLEIDIVLLPFFCQDSLCAQLEDELEHICKELKQCPEYDLNIERLPVEKFSGFTQFTNRDAEKHSDEKMADFVIWGKMLSPSEVTLTLKILKSDIDFFGDGFSLKTDNFKFLTFIGEFRSKLKQMISWASAIRHFYQGNYAESIALLKDLLDSGYEEIELNFRIAVLYDLMEQSVDANHYYCKTLNLVGVKKVINGFQGLFDLNFFQVIEAITTDYIRVNGDYINKEKLLDPNIMINEVLMLMIFEIVRVNLALKNKEDLPKEVFERVLVKTINQIQPSWLKTKYKDLFGKAYFELGVINENRLKEPGDIDPEHVYIFYENAALNLDIKHTELHDNCIQFFKKYRRLKRIIERMEGSMENGNPLLIKYKKSF
ncbi:hypothetical protein GCM10027284_03070 [Cyclobacterium sediminis]